MISISDFIAIAYLSAIREVSVSLQIIFRYGLLMALMGKGLQGFQLHLIMIQYPYLVTSGLGR